MKIYLIILLMLNLLVFSCQEDKKSILPQISGNIVGTWNWTSTCGGIVLACGYPTEHNHKIITFSDSMFMGQVWTSNTLSLTYKIINKSVQEPYTYYSIELSDGTLWQISINNNRLDFEFGEIVESYERIK